MITGRDISTHSGYDLILIRLREKGRRAVGQWPSGDLAGDLIRLVEARAEATTDKGTLSEVLAALVRQSAGLP
jgi:hypothetical protein